MSDLSLDTRSSIDLAEHERTYHMFLKGVVIFSAHVAVILVLLALFLL
jgi:hypothetical protein